MNPSISGEWLEQRRREDPDMYAREFQAEFVDGISAYLSAADVMACVRDHPAIRRPEADCSYFGTLDPAFSVDSFAMAVGHREADVTIVDGIWSWRKQGYENTLDQVKLVASLYGVRSLRTDQHAAEPIREGLEKRGISADYQPWTNQTKADAFARLKIALNLRQVELPNDTGLIEELCQLEVRPTTAGFARIAAAGSGHDDKAVVVAALMAALVDDKGVLVWSPGGGWDQEDPEAAEAERAERDASCMQTAGDERRSRPHSLTRICKERGVNPSEVKQIACLRMRYYRAGRWCADVVRSFLRL